MHSPEALEEKKSVAEAAIQARNNLIHKRLLDVDFSNDDDCHKLITELDEQLALILPIYDELEDAEKHFRDHINFLRDNPGVAVGQLPKNFKIGDHTYTREESRENEQS